MVRWRDRVRVANGSTSLLYDFSLGSYLVSISMCHRRLQAATSVTQLHITLLKKQNAVVVRVL